MAVAHRASTGGTTEFATVGTFGAVSLALTSSDQICVVLIGQVDSSVDQVTGVTIGGVAATRAAFNQSTSAEPGATYVYYLHAAASGGWTGASYSISLTTTANAGKSVTAVAATAAGPVTVVAAGTSNSGLPTNMSLSWVGPGPVTASYIVGFTGGAAPTALTVLGGTTDLHAGFDSGNNATKAARSSTPVNDSSPTVGWTQASDDGCVSGVMIYETVLAPQAYTATVNDTLTVGDNVIDAHGMFQSVSPADTLTVADTASAFRGSDLSIYDLLGTPRTSMVESTFESTLGDWFLGTTSGFTASGTQARSSNWASSGSWSMRVTGTNATGSGHTISATNERAATAGLPYSMRAMVRLVSGDSIRINVVWRDSGSVQIGSTASYSAKFTTGTHLLTFDNVVAPVGAALLRVSINVASGAVGQFVDFYVDDVVLVQAPSSEPVLADSVFYNAGTSVTVTDTLTFADTTDTSEGMVSSLADTLTIADTIAKQAAVVTATADSLLVTDGQAFASSKGASLADTFGVADATAVERVLANLLADTLTPTDNLLTAGGRGASPADTLTLTDTTSTQAAFASSTADTLSVADGQAFESAKGATLADTATVADAASAARVLASSLGDTLPVSDTLIFATTETLADTLIAADAVATASGVRTTISDTLSVADNALAVAFTALALSDALTLSDSATRVRTLGAQIADTLAGVDSLAFATRVTLGDPLALSDTAQTSRAVVRTAADALALADDPQAVLQRVQQLADAISLEDFAFTSGVYIHFDPPLGGIEGSSTDGIVFLVVADGTITVADTAGVVVQFEATGTADAQPELAGTTMEERVVFADAFDGPPNFALAWGDPVTFGPGYVDAIDVAGSSIYTVVPTETPPPTFSYVHVIANDTDWWGLGWYQAGADVGTVPPPDDGALLYPAVWWEAGVLYHDSWYRPRGGEWAHINTYANPIANVAMPGQVYLRAFMDVGGSAMWMALLDGPDGEVIAEHKWSIPQAVIDDWFSDPGQNYVFEFLSGDNLRLNSLSFTRMVPASGQAAQGIPLDNTTSGTD